jgi:hypothetical protein
LAQSQWVSNCKEYQGRVHFVLWKHKLAFVAIAVNGAYYVQGRTLRDRQLYCSAAKARPAKALCVPGYTPNEAAFKEWHVKLGHLNRDKLIVVILLPNMHRDEDEKDELQEYGWHARSPTHQHHTNEHKWAHEDAGRVWYHRLHPILSKHH